MAMGAIGIDGIGRYTASADGYSIGPVAMGNEKERERKREKEGRRERGKKKGRKRREKEREDKSNMYYHYTYTSNPLHAHTHTQSSIKKTCQTGKHLNEKKLKNANYAHHYIMYSITPPLMWSGLKYTHTKLVLIKSENYAKLYRVSL